MTAIIAIVGLAVLVWTAALLARGGPIVGALAVLIVGTCFGYLFFYLPVRPIPITADRVLFVIVMAIAVAGRRFGWTAKTPWNKADVLLAALLVLLTASVAVGDWSYRGNLPASRLLFYYLMPAGLYWITRQARLTGGQARLAFGVLTLLGIYLAATAVAELFRWREFIFPAYIASSEHAEFLGRGRGPFLNPASNGYTMSLGLCAMWMWWPRLAAFGRASIAILVLLFIAGLYATLTRCVWLGAVAMSVVAGAMILPRAWRAPLVILPLVLAVALAAVQGERLMELKRDEGRSAQEAVKSARLRPILAVVAWRMFLERPVFGCGFGHYNEMLSEVLEDRSSDFPLDIARHYVQHNVLLGLLTETGLAGAGIFTALYCCWLADSWRLWRSRAPLWRRQIALLFLASSASYVCNAMFQDLAITPTVNMILFFVAGLARAATAGGREGANPSDDDPAFVPSP